MAFIGRKIGRVARNHVVLGLGVIKGANATTLRDDGRLDLHRSDSPMASWTVALPRAMGFPYHASIRLPVLVSQGGLVAERQAAWKPPASFTALELPSRSLALSVLTGTSRVAGGGPGDRR